MDLGINGIWLMPVMPSVTYHKYDTTDYENIDPQYGTLETFQELLTACHDRGIRVILDLAMNHSSKEPSLVPTGCGVSEEPAGRGGTG